MTKRLLALLIAAIIALGVPSLSLAVDYGEDIEAEPFSLEDAIFDGFIPDKSTASEIYARYGAPDSASGEVEQATGDVHIIWKYSDKELTFIANVGALKGLSADSSMQDYEATAESLAKQSPDSLDATLISATLRSADITGPRGVKVGMTLEEVLVNFPDDGINYDAATKSRTLYTAGHTEHGEMPPCGVISDNDDLINLSLICPADPSEQINSDSFIFSRMIFFDVTFVDSKVSEFSLTAGAMAE